MSCSFKHQLSDKLSAVILKTGGEHMNPQRAAVWNITHWMNQSPTYSVSSHELHQLWGPGLCRRRVSCWSDHVLNPLLLHQSSVSNTLMKQCDAAALSSNCIWLYIVVTDEPPAALCSSLTAENRSSSLTASTSLSATCPTLHTFTQLRVLPCWATWYFLVQVIGSLCSLGNRRLKYSQTPEKW